LEALSIHILHHDSAENLAALLGSLHLAWQHAEARYKDLDVRIEVLDSGSLPATADLAEKTVQKERYLWNERLGYHRVPIHRGYARGHNELLYRVKPQGYVLFLDADYEANPDFFVALRPYLARSLDKRRLSCPVLLDQERASLGGHLSRWRARAVALPPDFPEVEPNWAGRVLMAPALLFAADGAWSEAYPNGGEDLELAWRLVGRKGWSVRPMKEVVFQVRTPPRQERGLAAIQQREIAGRGRFLRDAWPPNRRWAAKVVATGEVFLELLTAILGGRWPEAVGMWRGWLSW